MFGTDALLLGRFAQPRRDERALDLCSGCGIVALLWHDAGHRGPCTALEFDPAASALCGQAAAENGAEHITPVCTDLRQFCTAGPEQGQYDFAACNPPYFAAGPRSPDKRRAEARHTDSCTTADAVDAPAAPAGRGTVSAVPAARAAVRGIEHPACRAAGTQAAGLCEEPPRRRALAVFGRGAEGPQDRVARGTGCADNEWCGDVWAARITLKNYKTRRTPSWDFFIRILTNRGRAFRRCTAKKGCCPLL